MAIVSAVSLDISGFVTGIQRMQDLIKREDVLSAPMEQKMSAVKKTLLAGAVAFGVAVQRTYAAMSAGGELAKLSRDSDIAVGDLMRLQASMKTVELSAGDAESTVKKLRDAVGAAGGGSGPAADAFQKLSLKASDFTGLSMEVGIRKVADALRTLKDPVEQNQVSMALLGQRAEAMIDAFATGGHIESVAQAMGSQAAVMQASAGMFREVQKQFTQGLGFVDALKLKVQGFFVGVASEVAPQILGVFQSLGKGGGSMFDPTVIGQKFGAMVAIMSQAIRDGRLGEVLSVGLKVAFIEATALAQEQFTKLKGFISEIFSGTAISSGLQVVMALVSSVFESIFSSFKKLPDFLKQLESGLQNLADVFGGAMSMAFSKIVRQFTQFVKALDIPLVSERVGLAGAKLSGEMGAGGRNQLEAGKTGLDQVAERVKTLATNISGQVENGWKQLLKIFQGGGGGPAKGFETIVEELRKRTEEEKAALLKTITPGGTGTFQGPQAATQQMNAISRIGQTFGMYGTLGGGTVRGSFTALDPMVMQQRQSNQILAKIEANTSKGGGLQPPAYQS
jgi:uncharacterized protein YukE